ncbi:MAG TPA: hypothetical protein VGC36_15045 [Rhizomicrobium sp.]
MAPLYWILVLTAVAVMLWFTVRNNRKHNHTHRSHDLAHENDHLRHVVVQLAKERHSVR